MFMSHFARFVFAATFCAILTVTLLASPSQAQTFSVLYNAPGGNGVSYPAAEAIAQGRNGDMYTTSEEGGTIYGTLFSFTPAGTVNIVDDTSFGYFTVSGAIEGADGDLYGTDQDGGTGLCGTAACGRVYKVSPAGVLTVLHNFVGTDGQDPHAPPILGTNGLYYGTAPGSAAGAGISTAYSVSSSGTFTSLHTFSAAEGQNVYGGLVQGSDGNLYGVSATGGANGFGTIFKMTTSGAVTVLHSFNNTDGNGSYWPLIQASDGNYYGATYSGGANNEGVIFKITSSGTYTVLHSLNNANGDGQSPNSSLVQGTDSKLYGVTAQGPAGVYGTIFSITTGGTFSLLHTFSGTDGANPSTPLIQNTNGVFYGATSGGGTATDCDGPCGVIYSLNTGAKAFITLQSTSGKVGAKVGIFGQGFTAASVVKFNGVTATSVTRTGATYLTATVPTGATDGFVTVTTGSTTLTSTQKYTVHDSWGSGAVMPTATNGSAAGFINGKIYVVGGSNSTAIVGNNQVYNPTNNTWTTGAVMPTPVGGAASAVVNGLLYVIGGYTVPNVVDATNLVQIYNPKTNTWSTGAAMPTTRGGDAAAVDGTTIYVVGGNNSISLRLDTVEAYDTATNSWTEEAPLLVGKSEPTAGLLGTSIVSSGGVSTSGTTGDNESYKVSTNTWSELTADPTARNLSCFGVLSGQLYVAGGANSSASPINLTESFNLTSDKWTTLLSMPDAVIGAASAVANGQLYCFGGGNSVSSGGTIYNYVQIYQP